MSEILRLDPEALDWREVDGEVVALDRRESTYIAVNRSGGALWGALAEGATRDALVARLVDRFDVDSEQANADVDAFVAALRQAGYLES